MVFLCLIGGLVFTGLGAVLIFYSHQTLDWPTATAAVEYLDVVESSSGDGGAHEVAIRYRYAVAGIEYVSDRLNLVECAVPWRCGMEKKVANIRSKVDADGKIIIRYHPVKHRRSVVEAGITPSVLIFFAFGAGFTVLAGAMYLFTLRYGK